MPAIHLGDMQIIVQKVQKTTPALKVMNSDGEIYYASVRAGACPSSLVVGDAENPYTVGSFTLVYEEDSFDSCQTVTLEPGCYSVSVMGGSGGDGGNGGGGGGAVSTGGLFGSGVGITGGNGGSGSKGSSNTSYVRIYRLG